MALLAAMVAVASVFAMFACLVALYRRGQQSKPRLYKSASRASSSGGVSKGTSFAEQESSLHLNGGAAGATHRTVVLFGTQTGTSEGFAKELAEQINTRFPKSTVAASVDLEQLTPEVRCTRGAQLPACDRTRPHTCAASHTRGGVA